ncbi:MAG: type III-B CRISPR-associated protein Cas10/Cmr2, partial [Zetaproteobacteria bacterium]
LEGFPEAYWACVDWEAAIKDGSEQGETDWSKLDELVEALGGGEYIHEALRKKREGFYTPKAGAAFPGLFEGVERAHAAAKSARAFAQKPQQGYRCTICGEREWIGGDEIIEVEKASGEVVSEPAKFQSTRRLEEGEDPENLWHQIHRQAPMLAKNGEHLCAWCALKRFWPRLLADWLFGEDEERKKSFSVPMVSTHAMALAPSIEHWAQVSPDSEQKEAVRKLVDKLAATEGAKRGAWLPSRTAAEVITNEERLRHMYLEQLGDTKPRDFARRLPALLDALTEKAKDDEEDRQVNVVRGLVEQALGGRMERYYALVLMDGDRMGKWLAGEMAAEKVGRDGKEEYLLPMRSRLRSDLRDDPQVEEHADYWDAPRPVSPAWHQAISGALNSFSAELARVVVEEMFTGKLIYAGGDDLLAMVCVRD